MYIVVVVNVCCSRPLKIYLKKQKTKNNNNNNFRELPIELSSKSLKKGRIVGFIIQYYLSIKSSLARLHY